MKQRQLAWALIFLMKSNGSFTYYVSTRSWADRLVTDSDKRLYRFPFSLIYSLEVYKF